MKHILTPILLLVLLFPTLALGEEVVDWDDLVERDGLLYKKFTDVPFSGKVTGQRQGMLRNGKEEGPWVSYYDNGQLSWKGDYKNGIFDGHWVRYWENGELWTKGDYKNGKNVGPWVVYNADGTVIKKLTRTYKNGRKID